MTAILLLLSVVQMTAFKTKHPIFDVVVLVGVVAYLCALHVLFAVRLLVRKGNKTSFQA